MNTLTMIKQWLKEQIAEYQKMNSLDTAVEAKITREKCTYADKYKGIVMPTCGCRMCWDRWREQQLSREV